MPADADSLAEEGVVIEPFHLFRNGEENLDRLRNILTGKEGQRYPSRAVETNLADVLSQVAAVRAGVHAVTDLVERVGADKVAHFLERILRQSEDWMRKAVEGLDIPPEGLKAEVTLDGGGKICVAARPLDGGRLLMDGSGTEPGRGSFQCPFAVALSAILYACRLLVDRDIPLNEGLLRCVDIEIPEGCLLSASFAGGGPEEQPPVVAGNVEVSQRFVEALVRLFRLEADSQGTMNNVIFGNREFSHYETVAGGSGASGRGRGSSGVQVHMTNTAITDPEVLEHRFPVRVERFAIRQGSGGSGKNPGGDGVVREYFFEEEVELSLLTQHRDSAPLGLARGGPASPGRQVLINPSGVETELPYACTITVPAGSRLRVETPGGGGWGDGFDLTRIVRNLSCRSRPERVG